MKKLAIALALVGSVAGASAAGFAPLTPTDTGETCYTWEGGHKSAGSYSKCNPTVVIVAAPVVPAPLAAPPTPNAQMVPMQSCPPIAKPHHKPIVKRKPKIQC
jgi:hypothetical protein